MKLWPIVYQLECNGYVYIASRFRVVGSNEEKWSLSRRRFESPPIPPCTDVHTNDGWKCSIGSDGRTGAFTDIDTIINFVEEEDGISDIFVQTEGPPTSKTTVLSTIKKHLRSSWIVVWEELKRFGREW